jgi:catechol 2,3-dioxygenase-like lactoylglutathione lyase family enzyme
MITRFDHVVIAVRDLDAAMRDYTRLGFAVSRGGRHPGRGTENAIVRFGLDYLELLAIADEREARAQGMDDAALERFRQDGLLDYALASDDIATDAARLRSVGLTVHGPLDGSRRRPDGMLLAWQTATMEQPTQESPTARGFAHLRAPWPFLIQWATPDAERMAGDQPGAQPNETTRVWGVSLIVRDLDAAIEVYQWGLGLELVERAALGGMAAERAHFMTGRTCIDLLAPRGEGVVAQGAATSGEGLFTVQLATPDLEATRRYLAAAGIPITPSLGRADGLLIAPEAAMGARLVVHAGDQ